MEHLEIPIFAIAIYLIIIFNVPEIMEPRQPFKLKGLFALWNAFLSIFSIMGASRIVRERAICRAFVAVCAG
jgi:hypothetical protein